MTDESKVKTTFIRPVNRTMSYEDRRGYVCMYVYELVVVADKFTFNQHINGGSYYVR